MVASIDPGTSAKVSTNALNRVQVPDHLIRARPWESEPQTVGSAEHMGQEKGPLVPPGNFPPGRSCTRAPRPVLLFARCDGAALSHTRETLVTAQDSRAWMKLNCLDIRPLGHERRIPI